MQVSHSHADANEFPPFSRFCDVPSCVSLCPCFCSLPPPPQRRHARYSFGVPGVWVHVKLTDSSFLSFPPKTPTTSTPKTRTSSPSPTPATPAPKTGRRRARTTSRSRPRTTPTARPRRAGRRGAAPRGTSARRRRPTLAAAAAAAAPPRRSSASASATSTARPRSGPRGTRPPPPAGRPAATTPPTSSTPGRPASPGRRPRTSGLSFTSRCRWRSVLGAARRRGRGRGAREGSRRRLGLRGPRLVGGSLVWPSPRRASKSQGCVSPTWCGGKGVAVDWKGSFATCLLTSAIICHRLCPFLM